MALPGDERFRRFSDRKTREAVEARIHPLVTVDTGPSRPGLRGIGNDWTRQFYGGDFHLTEPPAVQPCVSLVFVQSREGNTVAGNPEELGGGPTDKHLIYEGLSRVAADAVLAGAATATGDEVLFSVWHPELVALRYALGLARHPAQIVVSNEGRVDFDALLFNVPELRVLVLAGAACRWRCHDAFARRPWITVVNLEPGGLAASLRQLRRDHAIQRISAIGGRTIASSLVQAGAVQDLCLTTSARSAGEPNTPFYSGPRAPSLELIVRKRGTDSAAPIVVEHFAIRTVSPGSPTVV